MNSHLSVCKLNFHKPEMFFRVLASSFLQYAPALQAFHGDEGVLHAIAHSIATHDTPARARSTPFLLSTLGPFDGAY